MTRIKSVELHEFEFDAVNLGNLTGAKTIGAVGYAKDCADSMSTLTTQGARREIPRGLNKLSVFLGVFVYHVGAKYAAPRAPHSPAVPRAVPVGHDRQKHAAAQPVGAGRHRQLRGAPRAIFFKSQSLKTCSLSKSDVG